MKILAYGFGLGAMISLFLVYQQKSRGRLLGAKLSADVFWVAHYACLGATAGMIPNFVGMFRELVFIHRQKHKWANLLLWPILFLAINLTLGILSFREWFDLLPILASSLVTVCLWLRDPIVTKLVLFPVCATFLVYDLFVGSYIGVVNESISIVSNILFFVRRTNMKTSIFSPDCSTDRELIITPGAPIATPSATISAAVDADAVKKGDLFAQEIEDRKVGDFERAEDKMCHVSTFCVVGDTLYMSYYANTHDPHEDPKNQTARLVWAPLDNPSDKHFIDLQTTGDRVGDKQIDMVYDTILMRKDEDTLYVMWTARAEENYYRFYCPFSVSTKTLGAIGVNRFRVGDTVNDFSVSGIQSALAANGIPCKRMFSDIGIMQKQSSRVENGEVWYYSGTYSGDFTCVIKSRDLITWEYVSQPDFINDSKWENATYVLEDKVYYFVRQQDNNPSGFLTAYDLTRKTWEPPVEIHDCQSRSDFIFYRGELYLFHAPIDREHIGVIRIDREHLANSRVVLQAKMQSSCFYPFIDYFKDGELAMSYTVGRRHIRLGEFTLSKYL